MAIRPLVSTFLLVTLGMLLYAWSAIAQADPANGFALYMGPVYSHTPSSNIHTHGLSVNADAQMALNRHWSLNPYLELSYEHTNQPYTVLSGSAGLQARYWVDHWFLGGQYLFHDENRRQSGNTTSAYYGAALGMAARWESDAHWSVVLELNTFEAQGLRLNYNDSRTDVRLQIGYRWY